MKKQEIKPKVSSAENFDTYSPSLKHVDRLTAVYVRPFISFDTFPKQFRVLFMRYRCFRIEHRGRHDFIECSDYTAAHICWIFAQEVDTYTSIHLVYA